MRFTLRLMGMLFMSLLIPAVGAPAAMAKSEKALAKQTAGENQRGEQMKKEALAKYKVLDGTAFNKVMNRVFDRLVATPEVASRALNYEVFLVESNEANAYCTPGGKVFVLSGMTSLVRQDADLWAALLGHELAHAVRSHSFHQEQKAEGISIFRKVLGQVGSMAPGLSQAGQAGKYVHAADIAGKAGTGLAYANPFLTLKFSRSDESDADAQGMLYMAKAGFDPAAAVKLHQELMSRFGDSKAMSTFLHTHPRESVRVEDLQALLADVRTTAAEAIPGQPQVIAHR